jgi:hypothetical protein
VFSKHAAEDAVKQMAFSPPDLHKAMWKKMRKQAVRDGNVERGAEKVSHWLSIALITSAKQPTQKTRNAELQSTPVDGECTVWAVEGFKMKIQISCLSGPQNHS